MSFCDFRGERANRILWERIELDEMMSWLSTLGGAFSALGDYKLACVRNASNFNLDSSTHINLLSGGRRRQDLPAADEIRTAAGRTLADCALPSVHGHFAHPKVPVRGGETHRAADLPRREAPVRAGHAPAQNVPRNLVQAALRVRAVPEAAEPTQAVEVEEAKMVAVEPFAVDLSLFWIRKTLVIIIVKGNFVVNEKHFFHNFISLHSLFSLKNVYLLTHVSVSPCPILLYLGTIILIIIVI